MSVITNKWNDGSGDSINIESPSFQGNQTVKISSPVQKGTSKRSMKFIGKCKKDSSKQVILTVEQEASVYTYDLTLNSDNTEIAAKGGTATITAVLKTYRNGNLVSTDNVTPVLSGSATGFLFLELLFLQVVEALLLVVKEVLILLLNLLVHLMGKKFQQI